MMNLVEKGLKVAEEEAEDALAEVTAMKATTLGQETGMVAVGALVGETTLGQETRMVAVGALAGETEAEVVVTETGMTTMREGPPVKNEVVVGLSLRTGMPAKREALKEIKLSLKATPAGELQNHLGEMIRQERRMETTPGVKTSHLLAVDHLSWASGVVHLAALLLVEDLGERATKRSPAGGVTTWKSHGIGE